MLKLPFQKVLIADDDPIQRELLEFYLAERRVSTVLQAANGAEAKAHLASDGSSIDLIISDVNMPETDGVEILMHVSSLGLKTSILIITGAVSPVVAGVEVLAKRMPVNFLGILKKPFGDQQLDDVFSKLPDNAPA